jgi:hypothetical protein
MALTEKLTSIADAIRTKTGSADKLTLDGMATAIAGIQTGGGSAMYSGSFTPTENVLSVEIDVGGAFTKFFCYALAYNETLGNGVKAAHTVYFDNLNHVGGFIGTNNGGTAHSAGAMAYSAEKSRYEATTPGCTAAFTDDTVHLTGIGSGTGFGRFLGGITYQWYAW